MKQNFVIKGHLYLYIYTQIFYTKSSVQCYDLTTTYKIWMIRLVCNVKIQQPPINSIYAYCNYSTFKLYHLEKIHLFYKSLKKRYKKNIVQG